MTAEKVLENKVRRMAQRQRFTLVKSRRRDPLAYEYGKYALWDELTNGAVSGWVDLDVIMNYLLGGPRQKR